MATNKVTVAHVLEGTWIVAQCQIGMGSTKVVIPKTTEDVIGQRGLTEVRKRFEVATGSPGSEIHREGDFYHIIPSLQSRDINFGASRPQPLEPVVPVPRPANHFILFRKYKQKQLKEEHPEMSNNDISKLAGRLWATEAPEIKDFFKQLSSKLKEVHMQAHPDYVYKPRKSSEKKRRMSAKKKEKLSNLATMLGSTIADSDSVPSLGTDGFADGLQLASFGNTDFIPFGDPTMDPKVLSQMVDKHNVDAVATDAAKASSVATVNFLGMAPTTQSALHLATSGIYFEDNAVKIKEMTDRAVEREDTCFERIEEYKDMSREEIEAQDEIWRGRTMITGPPELDAQRAATYWEHIEQLINESTG